MKRLNTIGDTIVEVLIAMVIISSVLGGAFVTVNRSLRSERAAEERSEALQTLQSQIEDLRTVPSANLNNQLSNNGAASFFCIYSNGTTNIIDNSFSAAVPASASGESATNFSEYPANCKKNAVEPIYHFSIVSTGSDTVDNTHIYLLRIRWHSADNGGVDELILEYKL